MVDVKNKTVNQLALDAYKIIGMYSEDRTPPSYRMIDAIDLLNVIIDELESTPVLIPYYKTLIFTATASKKSYTIGEESGVDVIFPKPNNIAFCQTIYNNTVQPVRIIKENIYYNAWSVDNVSGRPVYCWLERGNLISTLYFYPAPSLQYGILLRGKFGMDNLYNGDVLSDKITPSFYSFLVHALGRRLHEHYPTSIWGDVQENIYNKLIGDFTANDDKDISVKPYDNCSYLGYPLFNWG